MENVIIIDDDKMVGTVDGLTKLILKNIAKTLNENDLVSSKIAFLDEWYELLTDLQKYDQNTIFKVVNSGMGFYYETIEI